MELERVASYSEERQRLRLNCSANVQVETVDHRLVKGLLRDVGLHSLYLFTNEESDDYLIYGESVKVRVIMRRGDSTLTIELDGYVARMDEFGFVVKFAQSLKWWPVFTMFPVERDN